MERGDVIEGRYRLETMLGKGGLGVVWAASDLHAGREVAIKLLRPTADATDRRRFELEARALGRLHHRNCLVILDTGFTAGSEPFLVMERLQGQPLAALRGRPLPIEQVLSIGRQIAAALAYAHGRGITHRDLKPENVFLVSGANEPLVKVLDFGLAKFSSLHPSDITKTGEVNGTPHYMSPEQLRGLESGPASDVYSLGVVLFELVEGHRPFEGSTLLEIGLAHVRDPAPPIGRPDCPPSLARLISGALAKAPDARPTPAQIEARLGAGPDVPPLSPPPARPVARPRGWIAAAAVGTAVLAVLTALVVTYPGEDESDARRTDLAAAPPRTDPKQLAGLTAPKPIERRPVEAPSDPCRAQHPTGHVVRGSTSLGLDDVRVVARIPRGFGDGRARPVVFLLHHDRSSFDQFLGETGLASPADQHGIVVAGLVGDSPGRNALIVQTVDTALEWLEANLCIDRSKVALVSHGVGSVAAMKLSCATWVAGMVTASYLPHQEQPAPCGPLRATPALHIAPLDAPSVPAAGGMRCNGGAALMPPAASVDDLEAQWRQRNGCSGDALDASYRNGTCSSWTCDAPYTVCRIAGGNGWPGTRGREPFCPDSEPSNFPANDVVWTFLEPLLVTDAP